MPVEPLAISSCPGSADLPPDPFAHSPGKCEPTFPCGSFAVQRPPPGLQFRARASLRDTVQAPNGELLILDTRTLFDFITSIRFGDKLCNKQDGSKSVWLCKWIENMGFLSISSSITKIGYEPSYLININPFLSPHLRSSLTIRMLTAGI